MRFEHNLGRPMTDSEILALLRRDYPDKVFSIGRYGEIIEESERVPMFTIDRQESLREADDLRAMREAMLGFGAVESTL